jgi:hypothetical protein
MKTRTAPILFLTTFSILGFVALPVSAAKSPAMEACSKQWDDMKTAGKTGGKTWPSFWSDCSKDFAAKKPPKPPRLRNLARPRRSRRRRQLQAFGTRTTTLARRNRKRIATLVGMRTRQKRAPMDGTTISNLCRGAFDPKLGFIAAQPLEIGDKPTALSIIEKDPSDARPHN